jgi:hypothetical protein
MREQCPDRHSDDIDAERILFVVVVVKWLAGNSSPAARAAVWPP